MNAGRPTTDPECNQNTEQKHKRTCPIRWETAYSLVFIHKQEDENKQRRLEDRESNGQKTCRAAVVLAIVTKKDPG